MQNSRLLRPQTVLRCRGPPRSRSSRTAMRTACARSRRHGNGETCQSTVSLGTGSTRADAFRGRPVPGATRSRGDAFRGRRVTGAARSGGDTFHERHVPGATRSGGGPFHGWHVPGAAPAADSSPPGLPSSASRAPCERRGFLLLGFAFNVNRPRPWRRRSHGISREVTCPPTGGNTNLYFSISNSFIVS